MKTLKVTIEFNIKGDLDDMETLKEDVGTYLTEVIEEGNLSFNVEDLEDEEEDLF